MSSRTEIINPGGYRSDGRTAHELRTLSIDLSPQGSADGSAVVSHGLTKVSVNVFGPREGKMRAALVHDRANVHVEVGVVPFASGERRRRGRGDKRILELAATIRSTFEPVIVASLYPRTQIDIFVQILEQDGSVLAACINGTTLALMSAGIPMLDFVCAVSGGVHMSQAILDLTLAEESDVPGLTVGVLAREGKVGLATMETRVHRERLGAVLGLCGEAGGVLFGEMKRAVERRTAGLLGSAATGASEME